MFHATKALIRLEGKEAKTHKGLIIIFGKEFVKTGDLEKELGGRLHRMEEKREEAEYDYDFLGTEEKAKEALRTAKDFVKKTLRFIKEKYGIVLVVQK